VFVDVKTLYTLPPREAKAGCAEIVKHAFITSSQDINDVREALEVFPFRQNLLLTPEFDNQLVSLLARTIAIKAEIVSRDPLELLGYRKLLNFGHTIGHAFEACSHESDYSSTPLLHGEAVSIGMVGEAFLSVASKKCDLAVLSTLESILFSLGLPIRTPLATSVAPEVLLTKIRADKKNDFGAVRWTLLSGLGSAVSDQTIQEDLLLDLFQYLDSPYSGA
jgi:3-dehydroquinate synthase